MSVVLITIISLVAVLAFVLIRQWLKYDGMLRNAEYWVPRDFKRARSYMKKSTAALCQQYYDTACSMYDMALFSKEPFLYGIAVNVLRCKHRQDVILTCAAVFNDQSVEQFLEQVEKSI
jgi:hypothetical protein